MGIAYTPINTPNNTANFMPADENWEMMKMPFRASTSAIAQGTAVGIEISSNTTTGYLTIYSPENAAGFDFKGIMQEAIATTDADYATAGKMKMVWIPKNSMARAFFTCTAGTLNVADRFMTVEVTSGGLGLSCDTKGKGARIEEILVE
jgi:hypothetical protein